MVYLRPALSFYCAVQPPSTNKDVPVIMEAPSAAKKATAFAMSLSLATRPKGIFSIICFFTVCVFGYFATKYGLFVIEKERMSLYLQWPKGLWTASMIFGFLMLAVYFLLQIIKDFHQVLETKDQSHNNNKA
jgi:TRAP-type C4-dicarboxylate transport system permease small subunit